MGKNMICQLLLSGILICDMICQQFVTGEKNSEKNEINTIKQKDEINTIEQDKSTKKNDSKSIDERGIKNSNDDNLIINSDEDINPNIKLSDDHIIEINNLTVKVNEIRGHVNLNFAKKEGIRNTYNELIDGLSISFTSKEKNISFYKLSKNENKKIKNSHKGETLITEILKKKVNGKFTLSLYPENLDDEEMTVVLKCKDEKKSVDIKILKCKKDEDVSFKIVNEKGTVEPVSIVTDNGLIFIIKLIGGHVSMDYYKSDQKDKGTYETKLKDATVRFVNGEGKVVPFSRIKSKEKSEEFKITHNKLKTFSLYPSVSDIGELFSILSVGGKEYKSKFLVKK